jgi:ATP-dependent Lhr-like helicase
MIDMSILNQFHPAIAKWFTETFGAPSPPQAQGWPIIAQNQNVLILAPTGSGKTLAAFLWCINDLLQHAEKSDREMFEKNVLGGIHTLYISPLKALNNDIEKNLRVPLDGIKQTMTAMGAQAPHMRVLVRTGDTPTPVRQQMLKHPPHILITTPESLYIMLTSARSREMYRTVKYVIVDEIHALCNNKRGVHLSLSLERLAQLCKHDFVRIGLSATQRPLERIAAFLGGQYVGEERRAKRQERQVTSDQRPVQILDCGQKKETDLQIISAVEDFGNLPDASVWPPLTEKLYDLILQHRTTLIFCNMRVQTESLARAINELHAKRTPPRVGNELRRRSGAGEEKEIIAAHHGSLSKEIRLAVEDKLKNGQLPALAATSSLELGIDIGAIDCVVQTGSPKSVSRAMQRVGRSGHLVSATSKGRFFPLFRHDIADLAVVARGMRESTIEETHIPENCLDVLAQQIVAAVSVEDWNVDELYQVVRQSYCYRNLTRELFEKVLEMLSGNISLSTDAPVMRELRPKISYDRVNGKLIARRGARLLAITNGGTIPDRGYYSINMADSGTKVGEIEEEFVFESNVGDVFYLGSSEWRITAIERDRLIVAPASAERPRPPFWRGDYFYRDYESALRIGEFRRKVESRLDEKSTSEWLQKNYMLDTWATENLLEHFRRQREITGRLPSDETVIIEQFRDEVGDPRWYIHSVFGGRVNAPWAFAVKSKLQEITGAEVQAQYDDDGALLRFVDLERPPSMEAIVGMTNEEIYERNVRTLSETALFATLFRYNAARSLMLPRSQPGKRMPLWQQRLRARDLLQTVRKLEDFPLTLETYRDCFRDALDLENLKNVVSAIHENRIAVHFVETAVPSPFTHGLLFNFLSEFMYDFERSRFEQHSQAMNINRALLKEVLGSGPAPQFVTQELVAEAEQRWQRQKYKARDAEEALEILQRHGDLTLDEWRDRCDENFETYFSRLRESGRIQEIAVNGEKRWVAVEYANLYQHFS